MTKFKVGDKVRFIEDYMDYKKGDIVEVEGFWSEGIDYIGKGNSTSCYFSRVELVETKPTENQRIAALENEVAELKLIVHELRERPEVTNVINNLIQGPSATNTVEDIIEFEGQQYRKTVKVYELIEYKPLTANQQRAAIIEKAKKFVEETEKYLKQTKADRTKGNYIYQEMSNIVKFVINEEKRTIVALLYNKYVKNKLNGKGIAKCNPSDVFNEHIGKAIALGRPLGLDVSEFEQAVQPDKVVSGMKIKSTIDWPEAHFGKISKGDIFEVVSDEVKQLRTQCYVNSAISRNSEIIDDTNAIY